MRDGCPIDLPVLEPIGAPLPQRPARGLRFCRAFTAPLDAVVARWCEPELRRLWILPISGSCFTILLAAPAYLEAEETDGLHAVRLTATFEEDGVLTTVCVRIEPLLPLTTDTLLASGYADRWEERLYALADLIDPEPWEP
ncbi:MAG: hypothetical protein KIT10_01580 [Flavobacteriales bacterium]|nr:hypothetical protein [Flavobacteriales bacterium]